jgi:hypothetical protein
MMAEVEKKEIEYLKNLGKLEDKLNRKQTGWRKRATEDNEEMLKDYESIVKTVDIDE